MHTGEAHALRSQRGALPARAAPGASRRRSPAERRSRIPGAGTRRPLPPARPSPAVIPSPRSHAERPAPMPLRRGILSQTLFVPVPARGPCPSPLTGLWRRAGAAGAQCSRAAASSAAAGSGGRAMPGGEERPGRAGSDMGRGGSRSAFYPPAAACPPPAPPFLPPSRPPPPPLLPFVLPSSGYSLAGRGDAARRYRGRSRPGTGPPRRSPAPPGFMPPWEGGREGVRRREPRPNGAGPPEAAAPAGGERGGGGRGKRGRKGGAGLCAAALGLTMLFRLRPSACTVRQHLAASCTRAASASFQSRSWFLLSLGSCSKLGLLCVASLGGGLKSGAVIPQAFTILYPVRALWCCKSSCCCPKAG